MMFIIAGGLLLAFLLYTGRRRKRETGDVGKGEQGHERDMAAWGTSTVKAERIQSEPIKNQKKVRRGT